MAFCGERSELVVGPRLIKVLVLWKTKVGVVHTHEKDWTKYKERRTDTVTALSRVTVSSCLTLPGGSQNQCCQCCRCPLHPPMKPRGSYCSCLVGQSRTVTLSRMIGFSLLNQIIRSVSDPTTGKPRDNRLFFAVLSWHGQGKLGNLLGLTRKFPDLTNDLSRCSSPIIEIDVVA